MHLDPQSRISGRCQLKVRIDGSIIDVAIVDVFIGAILQPKLDHSCRYVIAQSGRSLRKVLGQIGGRIPQQIHLRIESRE